MIGTYKLDAEVWALPFPVTMTVRAVPDMKALSVYLIDATRGPLRFRYLGPMLGVGDRQTLKLILEWLSDFEPSGLNYEASHHIGVLLAALWAKRFVHDVPNPNRSETQH